MSATTHPIEVYAPAGSEVLTDEGKTCLWVAFAGLFIPCIYFFIATMRQEDGKRYYHTLSFMINAIASTAYLAMATGYGVVYVYGKGGYRTFFYARYIDWALTTPLMLLDLAGLAGASNDTTFFLVAADFLMIVTGLIGALIGSDDNACWAFWAFGMFAFLPILYFLGIGLPTSGCGPEAAAIYKKAANLTLVVWSIYPVVWILAEGTGTISTDGEVIFYTVLDIIAKSGFGLLIVNSRDGLEQALGSSNDGTPMIPVA